MKHKDVGVDPPPCRKPLPIMDHLMNFLYLCKNVCIVLKVYGDNYNLVEMQFQTDTIIHVKYGAKYTH